VVEVLEPFRGVLIMPYVVGLSLQSAIAIRHNDAGTLGERLVELARFLADLHAATAPREPRPDFAPAGAYGHQVIQQLARNGVLQGDSLTRHGLEMLVERWAGRRDMRVFMPAFVHGDATTGNFLFCPERGVTGIDWERAQMADPAHDLGRLAAEVTYSIGQHGGDVIEAERLIDSFCVSYRTAAHAPGSAEEVIRRARYYRAISSLRIARNAWIPRSSRLALVAQALALLSAE
jgi:aminoglycoside phosphotransferase (APT) family kinase protein